MVLLTFIYFRTSWSTFRLQTPGQ